MKIDFIGNPTEAQWDELCALWKEAFGDSDSFLQIFHATAFHPQRCCCLITEGRIAAALYWFDCSFQNRPVAYLYAIATAKAYQNKGLCHQLMQYVHKYLSERGYAAALLVPASPALRTFYEKMGYHTCTYISRTMLSTDSLLDAPVIHLRELNTSEYAQLRREYLPADSIFQEKENLDFLETQTQFFYIKIDSKTTLIAASKYGTQLHATELLGNSDYLSQILQVFNCQHGTFQMPGNEIPFAMWLPFQELDAEPKYFGFAFD